MGEIIARIAIAAANVEFDRPYDYLMEKDPSGPSPVGCRVYVPFGNGNRCVEGIVLGTSEKTERNREKLKTVIKLLDREPVLTPEQIGLALFMRERYFCTVYDAVKSILPVGMWLNENGRTRVSDKKMEMARLRISAEEATAEAAALPRAKARAALLRELAPYGEMPVRELLLFAGTTVTPLKKLAEDGLIELFSRELLPAPLYERENTLPLPLLNEDQSAVFRGLEELRTSGMYGTALLQGITGSGKTSVYIRLIDSALKEGKTAILLVPEIALTPQMLQTFSSYFGKNIAVLHSGLTIRERYEEWKRLKNGNAKVAVGTRSAIFAPVKEPGIIIIDEEQEDTYRSENNPRYDARDIARYIAFKSNCLLLLGSATPDVCTRYSAENGKTTLFRLDRRYNERKLPAVHIVSMKEELKAGNDSCISSFLRRELQENIDRGEQSILFLNRRGARKLITCPECGFEYNCPNCSVPLTYHSVNNRLICHYCGHTETPALRCPDCGGILKYIGAGTQLVEEELRQLFPGREILRMDADILSASQTHRQIFDRFQRENIPIMIGTQMVTKGLNFENVTLVGVILADQSLNVCSIRAPERTFSLITQVIGRSGRGSKPGRAVIQTYSPRNEVILQAARQDYDAFYNGEIKVRAVQDAPPYSDLIALRVFGKDETRVVEECGFIRARLVQYLGGTRTFTVMGPTPLPVVKVSNSFRYRVILKCRADSLIRGTVLQILKDCSGERRFKDNNVFAEPDPEL